MGPGVLAYLGEGRDDVELVADGPARAVLLGGEPFPEPILMSWNFVARERDEVDGPARGVERGRPRFGAVDSALPRIPAPTSGTADPEVSAGSARDRVCPSRRRSFVVPVEHDAHHARNQPCRP